MEGPPTIEAGDHTSEELLARLRDQERLIVRADVLGSSEEMTLRFDGETFYRRSRPNTSGSYGNRRFP